MTGMTDLDGRFAGRVAIVTGGALGIGGGTARKLASQGASVLVADVNDEAADANVAGITANGGTARAIHTDVGSHDDIKTMIDTAVSNWGRLDILVQNAYDGGRRVQGSAIEVAEEDWDHGMGLLTKALYLGAKYSVPEMQKTGGGSIVNLASVHGFLMAPRKLVYEAGKAAVIGMTKQMAIDFGPLGIRVNCILPGHIVTEKSQTATWDRTPGGLEFFEQQYPVRRTGVPEDIANAISFLCSDDASFITGHPLAVDGGLTIQLQEDLGVALGKYARENEFEMPY
ncbi:MAG: glucose 1-dehydrogenase [Dehalococcoidia bacterium]|jgi:NAD(P)-dependent dehydrogenase (short-subunit alcohol dehydrogenase family)|nr:glucose 1-dehydrogenase [Dehalococcoidia bacterium]